MGTGRSTYCPYCAKSPISQGNGGLVGHGVPYAEMMIMISRVAAGKKCCKTLVVERVTRETMGSGEHTKVGGFGLSGSDGARDRFSRGGFVVLRRSE